MKILHINTAADIGGAARALLRLHRQLLRMGHTSHILSRLRKGESPNLLTLDETITTRLTRVERLLGAIGLRTEAWFGFPGFHLASHHIPDLPEYQWADIIHLNNLHGNYFDDSILPEWSKQKPLFWTLHDMWAFTGHCAYAYDCDRWKSGCGSCPMLKRENRAMVTPPPTRIDFTARNYRRKQRILSRAKPQIITPSTWLMNLAKESPILSGCKIHHIPYGVDLDIYHPMPMSPARTLLGIPEQAQVLLFAADQVRNPRKGFAHLIEALQQIPAPNPIYLLTFGGSDTLPDSVAHYPHRSLGWLTDEALMCQVYNAADLLIFPSLADNLPLVLLEALACGTPAVAFASGGVPDVTRHMETGYLARAADAADLAAGIQALLSQPEILVAMRQRCREIAEQEYNILTDTQRLIELYENASLTSRSDKQR